jgi:hypothetical protein
MEWQHEGSVAVDYGCTSMKWGVLCLVGRGRNGKISVCLGEGPAPNPLEKYRGQCHACILEADAAVAAAAVAAVAAVVAAAGP